jgi:hypothetical protein
MKKIEIDDEVYAYLQGKAIPFVETPNLTLRRLLGVNGKKGVAISGLLLANKKKKQQKTDLPTLVQAGLLADGQTLYLHDYRGTRISGYEATISGKYLLYNNKMYSMSELAKRLLKKEGFNSNSVRGPAHWYNTDGISVKELWTQFLKGRIK